jgi:dephospho-CoA kinase
MVKSYIINITGIQGSGKSYICSKLKDIYCIDTDKVLDKTFTRLLKNSEKFRKYLMIPDKNQAENFSEKASNLLFTQANKDLQKEIANSTQPLIIVVGITLDVKSDIKFFIKLNSADLEKTYRRVMMREADKIKNNYNIVKKIINNENIHNIAPLLHYKYEIGAINQIFPFAGYRKLYQEITKYEKEQNALIKSQSQIIKHIRKIHEKLNK